MTYDGELVGRVRGALAGERVDEKAMFGGLAFLVGGHLAVAASSRGGLMVRVGADSAPRLLQQPGVEQVEMGARGPMKAWVRVGADALADDEVLRAWVQRGVTIARSLPPG